MTTARTGVRAVAEALTAPVGSIRRVDTASAEVILTYDDGPDPVSTRQVLAALADVGFSATFFVLLGRARSHPDVVREAVAAGHEVALHGWDHRRLQGQATGEVRRRAARARDELEGITAAPVRWFRPPYGAQSLRTWAAVRSCGLTPVMWSASSRDSRPGRPQEMLDAALSSVSPGAILLSHDRQADESDLAAPAPRADVDRGALARALTTSLVERGYRGVCLADALAAGGRARRSAWFGG